MEILHNNTYGLLCDHDDEAIYQAVKQMMDTPELRRKYRELGLKRAKEFDVSRTVKGFEKLVNS